MLFSDRKGNVSYILLILQCIPRDKDKVSPAVVDRAVLYYLIPCLFLFERCDRLLNLVLDEMASLALSEMASSASSEMASLALSKSHAPDPSHTVGAIVCFLQLIYEDIKAREMLFQSKVEIEHVLKNISLLQVSIFYFFWEISG